MVTMIKTKIGESRILKAACLILFSTFLIVCMNTFGKVLTEILHPVEVVFYRNLVALLLILGIILYKRQWSAFRTKKPVGHIARGLVGNGSLALVFWAYSLMPMADVTALLFTAPLIVTFLSPFLLDEKVGIYRWSAVLVGFAGVLLMAHPTGGTDHFGILVGLAAACGVASVNITLRYLGKTEDAMTTVFYFLLIGTVASGLLVPFLGHGTLPLDYKWYIIGIGLVGGIAQIAKTEAYRLAPASVLGPFVYTSIIWATLFGFLIWNDIPTVWVALGAAIVIGSNIFITWRETVKEPKKKAMEKSRAKESFV